MKAPFAKFRTYVDLQKFADIRSRLGEMPRGSIATRAFSTGSEGLTASPFLTDDQRAALDAALAKKKAEEGGFLQALCSTPPVVHHSRYQFLFLAC